MKRGYRGDVSPEEAWTALASETGAVLVDVRTAAEWSFVGLPDLSSVSAKLHCVEWQSFPGGQLNPTFVEALQDVLRADGTGTDAALYFICRSGARSAAAAAALTAAGHANCYNVAGGFEGGRDQDGHRGTVDGWKVAGLPWVQS